MAEFGRFGNFVEMTTTATYCTVSANAYALELAQLAIQSAQTLVVLCW